MVEPPTTKTLNVLDGLSSEISGPLNPCEFMKWSDCLSGITICFKNDKSSRSSIGFWLGCFSFSLVSIIIIPVLIKNSIALRNSPSEIWFVAHHPAVFLIHWGINSEFLLFDIVFDTWIISSFIKNCIPLTNTWSSICPSAHHPAVFFTQSGTDCATATGKNKIRERNITENRA